MVSLSHSNLIPMIIKQSNLNVRECAEESFLVHNEHESLHAHETLNA